ncbi:MAG TPA: cytochrome c oxidase subunit 3 [Aggregatilineales bacterium]|nr:cytochrome c oxidase subunit 3 [Aggregatilineales bacterium]
MDLQLARTARLNKFDEQRQARDRDLKNKRTALQLWRVANGGVFAFFILANYLMRQQITPWPPAGVERISATIPLIISLALLLSSWTALRAQRSIRVDNAKGLRGFTLMTLALGVVFLAGMALVWRTTPMTGPYSAIFFTMTGFHALHVLAGMIIFGYVYSKSQRGAYSAENYWGVEAAVVFWHFVDVMWLLYFVVLFVF